MIYGYARTSTVDQKAGLEAQMAELRTALRHPCQLHAEEASAVGERPILDGILAKLQKGDQLVVTKLDRLARSVVHLGQLLETIHAAGASLRILNLGMDTSTPTGKMILNVLGSVAQFEREMMLERQADGIAAAKAAGVYKGRKPRHDPEAVRAFVQTVVDNAPAQLGRIVQPGDPTLARTAAGHFGLSVRQVQRILAKG